MATVPKRRAGARALRRRQLILSTIDSIAERGFAETTLARVADGAGLSRGIVNFHFQSKDALLVDTLRHLADEYRAHWSKALGAAAGGPAERLAALIRASFDPVVCNRKKVAVWYAFYGEARSRPKYLRLCGAFDEEHCAVVAGLCQAIIDEGGYEGVDAASVARGMDAMIDGMWLNLLLGPRRFKREACRDFCISYLANIFPRHFAPGAVALG